MNRDRALVLGLLLLTSCGTVEWPLPFEPPDVRPEDELIQRVYDGPRWPPDMVVDPQLENVRYLGFNVDEGRNFPCVADVAEAESLAAVAGYWTVGDARTTDLYFEFDNARPGFGRPIVRVYRSSYLESLTLVPLFAVEWPGGGMGKLGPVTHSPLTRETVAGLFDDLLPATFTSTTLIARRIEERDADFVVATHEALLVGGDWGICDGILQMVTTYTIAKSTGEVSITHFVLPAIRGRCPYGT